MTKKDEPGRDGLDLIEPGIFCTTEAQKTKLNWFCYELARGIYLQVEEGLGRRLRRQGIDAEGVARSSIQLANWMKGEVLERLSGGLGPMRISHEMVETILPGLDDRLVDGMLDAVARAWDGQLSACEACPTRCLSEWSARCTMFDEGPLGDGW